MASSSASTFSCELFAVELRTHNWQTLVAWYRDVLGMCCPLRVVEDGYALLTAGPSRLAIMEHNSPGEQSDRMNLAFEVDDLAACREQIVHYARANNLPDRTSQTDHSPEGFCYFTTRDPDDNRVRVFTFD